MKIKKIAMVGFKSFMDKLEVPVASGLSAIVGPNGCGKSNIVDAIRWAMGEQSAKLLRGRNMEDVIFNGADNVKPLGMAEVSIIFENGDGSFPTQYAGHSELSVTRRLYRSGESEYLINNVPCRLKDIQEVFMDTGLGNRAYSIIGQGRISTIIEQKPEETRAMIEEAAGITKYKKKVEESQRKIEMTQANLARVEDILNEVERQMRSLKRQAAKAGRFKKIGNEIKELEVRVHANAYKELNEESGLRLKSAEGLVQEELARSTEYATLQAKIETMNLDLEEKDQRIQVLKNDYGQLKERVQKKESNLEFMAREEQMQVELEIRLNKEREDLSKRLTELQTEKAALLDQIAKARETFINMEDEMAMLEKRLKGRQDLLKEVKEQYEEARTRVHSGKTQEMSLTQESGYLNKRIGEITDGKSRLEKEKEEVRQKSEEFATATERKTEVRQALEQKLQAILADMAREQARRDELNEKKKKLEADLKAAEHELNLSRSRLTSLRSLTENFEGYKVGVRTIMKASDLEAQRTGRILGLVADVIQVEPQYEQAVEAVLADKLQHIIVENIQDGREAIEYLKTHAKGRSSFVPLKDLREDSGRQNGLPLLRNLIKTEARYQPILNVLLGDAALVDNLEQAIAAWKSAGNEYCLVTRDGDIIEKNGVISGGKISQNTQGILARKREITELEQKVTESEGRVNGLTDQVNAFDAGIGNCEALLKKLAEEKEECQEKINELDKALFRLSHEIDQLAKLAMRITNEIESKDKEQGHHKEALTKIESELQVCLEKRKQHEDYFLEKETELKESEAEFEQFRNELSDRKLEFGRLQEGERGLTREVERIDDFSKNAQQTFERIEQDIQTAKKRYQECLEQEEMIKEELQTFFSKLQTAEETVNGAEQERGG
jgi:chromosome segregation protein